MVPGSWKLVKNKGVPAQLGSVNCRVFMLIYALYKVFNWEFDFTQNDMAHIRRWWVNPLLSKMTHGRKRKRTSAMSISEETKRQEAGQVQNIEILMLPDAVLSEILLHVVLKTQHHEIGSIQHTACSACYNRVGGTGLFKPEWPTASVLRQFDC
ncbi:uncharacterized protein LOC143742417 [Siphateles boraxobius]|uniref:uncharacterized protein LOC143742417 n=1 Tax=Siphateles boraxobius TaxID=180520 RepID=UPI0040641745